MVKIIKKGDISKKEIKWIYTVTCKTCGCVFECESKDLDWRNIGFFNNANFTIGGIACPYCKKEVRILGDNPCRKELPNDD